MVLSGKITIISPKITLVFILKQLKIEPSQGVGENRPKDSTPQALFLPIIKYKHYRNDQQIFFRRFTYTIGCNNRPATRNTAMNARLRALACFSASVFALTMMVACSKDEAVEDLAVAKIPVAELQSTGYLPLNADKPGTFVEVEKYLVPGKYTLVAYFSPFDGVYAGLEPRLVQLTQARPDIAVRTVNVNRPEVQGIDWQSPVLGDLGITKLPYFQIFDPAQSLRAQARPAYEQVSQWVQSLGN